jgi:hypothetical protein
VMALAATFEHRGKALEAHLAALTSRQSGAPSPWNGSPNRPCRRAPIPR